METIQALARQIAHLQAEMYAHLWELAHTPPGDVDSPPDRTEVIDDYVREEVQAALTMSPRAADLALGLAGELDRFPSVLAAFKAGRIDLPRVRAICKELEVLDETLANQVIEGLISEAPGLTTGQLARRIRRRCHKLDPENSRFRYQQGVEDRHIQTQRNPDGTADISARQLPVDRVAHITARIQSLAEQLKREDDRSIDQIRADIVMDLLEGNTALPQGARSSIQLRVDLETLMELNDHPAEISGWGPIIADLARRLTRDMTDGQWTAAITHPDSGQPMWNGAVRRRPTTAQRRHTEARNPTCVFPGCSRPARNSHIDHTVDHSLGGPTHPINLGPLCAVHHLRSKHRAGWKLTQPRPGHYHWVSPRQRQYDVRPPPPD